ncbi:alpha/beta hydrolase [Nocardia sp. NPDC003693]
MNHRGPALTAVAAALLAAFCAGPGAPAGTAGPVLGGEIAIPCAASQVRQSAEWYLPDGEPRGMVWVQHGFARNSGNVASLARTLSDAGYLVFAPSLPFFDLAGCTLQNLGDNTPFLDEVAELFATAGDPAGPLARSLSDAAARQGVTPPAIPANFVFVGHSAGGEAVEYVAHSLHVRHPATWDHLRGVVLLDPVKSFLGSNTDRALTDLDGTDLPILAISAPPSLCNNFGTGTTALESLLHRPFLGVRLPAGTHTDAEGTSSDALGEAFCGTPDATNIDSVELLTAGWAGDFFAGATTADFYAAATAAGAEAVAAVPGAVPLRGAV